MSDLAEKEKVFKSFGAPDEGPLAGPLGEDEFLMWPVGSVQIQTMHNEKKASSSS